MKLFGGDFAVAPRDAIAADEPRGAPRAPSLATTHTMAAVQLADARPESSSSDEDDEVESDSESGDDEQKDFYYDDKYKEDDNYLGEDVFRVEAIRSTQRARTSHHHHHCRSPFTAPADRSRVFLSHLRVTHNRPQNGVLHKMGGLG